MENDEHIHEEKPRVNKVAVGVVVVLILLVCAGLVAGLVVFKPTAGQKEVVDDVPRVKVIEAKVGDFLVVVPTQGVVVPRTETRVASEVSGRVTRVADHFERGAAFEKGDVLLEIDDVDYTTAVVGKRAEVEEAKLGVLRAEVEVEKGKREWAKLGNGREANPLVLGLPQLERARAMLDAAQAGLAKAERDLERTKIRAPYDGRVRSTATDLGSFVTMGTPLAELYASDVLEVRLPVSQSDYAYLDEIEGAAEVEFALDGRVAKGKVVRVEGEIDGRTRSRYLIAEVDSGDVVPGQFLEGKVAGEILKGVIELPREAVHGRNRVLVAKAGAAGDVLEFRTAEIVRSEKAVVLVRPGDAGKGELGSGERVIVTPLAAPIKGMAVKVTGTADEVEVIEGSEVPG